MLMNIYINLLDDVHVGALHMEIVQGSFKWNKFLWKKNENNIGKFWAFEGDW